MVGSYHLLFTLLFWLLFDPVELVNLYFSFFFHTLSCNLGKNNLSLAVINEILKQKEAGLEWNKHNILIYLKAFIFHKNCNWRQHDVEKGTAVSHRFSHKNQQKEPQNWPAYISFFFGLSKWWLHYGVSIATKCWANDQSLK